MTLEDFKPSEIKEIIRAELRRLPETHRIDLEINKKFRPLYFHVEYERSKEYLDLNDFERFYQTCP